jgi:hypothetical protein
MKKKMGNKVWDRVRGWYQYPSLKDPKMVRGLDGGACYDFTKHETLVDEGFLASVCKNGNIEEERCLEGIFTHEIGHYMVFPKTRGRLILSAKMIDDFFGKHEKELREFILQTYADMANDLASVLNEVRTDAIIELRNACQANFDDEVNKNVRAVMLSYLHHQAHRKFDLDTELEPFFERMKEIDFLNSNVELMRLGIWTFGNIIVDMIKKYDDGKCSLTCGKGTPQDNGGSIGWGPIDCDIDGMLGRATEEEIKEALREIAGQISKGEFDRLKEWLKDKDVSMPKLPKAITIGTSSGELPVDQEVIQYYFELSKQQSLVVTKKLLETEGKARSWSETEKWRPGKDPNLALPNSSGGKFYPGITRSIRISERPIKTTDYTVPHLLVVIDSSGSMPIPKDRKSYAVLGGYCGARSYHLHGSSIGVINFSGQSFYLPYTRNLEEALGAISAFQGGGTVVDVEMIRQMLGPGMAELYKNHPHLSVRGLPKKAIIKNIDVAVPEEVFSAESIDVMMFTDGGIANLNETLELFREKAQLNRATIILTHDCFEQEIAEFADPRISIHKIDAAEDIPKIVIGETQKNFSYFVKVKK